MGLEKGFVTMSAIPSFHVIQHNLLDYMAIDFSSVYIVPGKCKLHPLTNPSGFVGDLLAFI